MQEQLLSRRETARLLGISTRTLFDLVQAGEIRVRRVRSRVLFPISEISRFARPSRMNGKSNSGLRL
ncbi:MAG: helix-turn-helix domain-containing protein [Acidobacteria bacterium]|nr:helix-turn-helix domain-containing protein [Acidobacteriota bacterium]